MNTIFYNGKIRTLDNAYPIASAVAVKNGVIMRIGTDEEILPLAEENTQKVDLQGKLMLPGFVDSHQHLLLHARYNHRIDLSSAASFQQAMDMLKEAAQKLAGTDKWVLAGGFNQDYWTDRQELPTREDLDKISGDVAMSAERICGHVTVLNTKALRLLGKLEIRAGENPNLGFFSDGTPNGQLFEKEVRTVEDYFDIPSVAEIKELIVESCNEALSKGIVGVHSDDFNYLAPHKDYVDVMQAFKELAADDELPIRVYQQCKMMLPEDMEAFLADGYRFHDTFGNFKIGPIKVIGDGSIGAHSAALLEPYKNDPGTKGIYLHDDEECFELIELAHKNGFSVAVHAIGDGATKQALDGFELAMKKYPRPNPRHGIVHCQIMDAAMQDRFREMNVIAYVQPVFVRYDSHVVDDCVGSELGKQSYNWRRYIDLGVHMCGGSDCPVEPMDVLPNIYYAVTRSDGQGGFWYPENGVTLDEAVRMFTVESAYAAYEEQERGTITVGKYADFTVLDRDIYENPVEELLQTQVMMTVVNGKIMYQK